MEIADRLFHFGATFWVGGFGRFGFVGFIHRVGPFFFNSATQMRRKETLGGCTGLFTEFFFGNIFIVFDPPLGDRLASIGLARVVMRF